MTVHISSFQTFTSFCCGQLAGLSWCSFNKSLENGVAKPISSRIPPRWLRNVTTNRWNWLVWFHQLTDEARESHAQLIERAEIANLVRSRMDSLSIDTQDYDDVSEKRCSLSYVIINPSCDLKLEEGDIMLVSSLKNISFTTLLQQTRFRLLAPVNDIPSTIRFTKGIAIYHWRRRIWKLAAAFHTVDRNRFNIFTELKINFIN